MIQITGAIAGLHHEVGLARMITGLMVPEARGNTSSDRLATHRSPLGAA
jgi:hypothetical protein